jgi:hypothetical protein
VRTIDAYFVLTYAAVRDFLDSSQAHARQLRVLSRLIAGRSAMHAILLHTIATLVIVMHFFLVKWAETLVTVPPDAIGYIWQRLIPSVEFGMMHSTLFQLALLRITMCRHLITTSAITNASTMHFAHLHLGYAACLSILAVACSSPSSSVACAASSTATTRGTCEGALTSPCVSRARPSASSDWR